MFLQITDLGSTIYSYQIEAITEGNDDIKDIALAAAEEEIKSYLTGNNQIEWLDGRLNYDVDAIFSASGTDRNALIVKHCVIIAKWWLVDLCNADMIYEQSKERYDRTINWLKQLASGEVNIKSLPQIDTEAQENPRQPFSFGSRKKFNHG
mgnify:CR=1 FL=1